MRIVVDTNVLASAVFFGGKPGECGLFLPGLFQPLPRRRYWTSIRIPLIIKGRGLHFSAIPIFSSMEIIPVKTRVAVCRDPDDDKFISCAIDGQCYYVVSGDKDLLTLKKFRHVKIVTVSEFLELMQG